MSLNTPRLNLPYPEPQDPNDVPADMQALATAIEEAPGVADMTTVERDALTGAQLWVGRMIYNTDTATYQSWDGAAWNEDIGGIPGAGVAALYRQDTAPVAPEPGTVWFNSGEVISVPGPVLYGYRERWQAKGNVSGTVTLDFSQYNSWTINPTAAVTIAFAGLPTNADEAVSGTLVVQNSTYAITWPAGTKFPDATPPVINGKTYLSIVVEPGGQVVVGLAWGGIA